MGYRAEVFVVSKVELTGRFWAELRPISKGEAEAFQAPGLDEKARSEAGEAMLVKMIARWNLDADDGTIIPITREAVADLSLADYGKLVTAISTVINPLADGETAKK